MLSCRMSRTVDNPSCFSIMAWSEHSARPVVATAALPRLSQAALIHEASPPRGRIGRGLSMSPLCAMPCRAAAVQVRVVGVAVGLGGWGRRLREDEDAASW